MSGQVSSQSLIADAAYYIKNYVAVGSVLAEMQLEEQLLVVSRENPLRSL